jgi:hypothetical protein
MPLAATEQGLDELTHALIARDKYGIVDMLTSGRAFDVANGTRVLVIERPGFFSEKVHIRVVAGPMAGRAGWTYNMFVSK